MLIEICRKRDISPTLVRELLHIESTPPRQGKRGVNVRSREAIETFAQSPEQLAQIEASPPGNQEHAEIEYSTSSGPTIWLQSIELKNFAQFEDARADFEYRSDRPICLVEANNGHGKSTLIQAVLHALYGTPRGRSPQLVHHSAKGAQARVEVRLKLRLEGQGDVGITRFSTFHKGNQSWSQEESNLTVVSEQGESETASTPRARP